MKSKQLHLLILAVLVSLLCIAADAPHGVRVHLVNSEQKPLSGVVVELELYEYSEDAITIRYIGKCTTDAIGQCRIEIEKPSFDATGFLRGRIVVGDYGKRALIWRGGILDVPVWLDAANTLEDAGESQPYAGQQAQEIDLRIIHAPRLRLADVIIPLVVIGGLLTYFLIQNNSNKRGNDEEK
jgi:hypothetical protein